jgi:hypothetical protein
VLHYLVHLRTRRVTSNFLLSLNAGSVSSSKDVNTLPARGIHPSRVQIQFKCDFRRHSRESYKHRFPGNIPGLAPDGCLKLQKVFDGHLLCSSMRVLSELSCCPARISECG